MYLNMGTVSKKQNQTKSTLYISFLLASTGTGVVEYEKQKIKKKMWENTGSEIYGIHTPTYLCVGHI